MGDINQSSHMSDADGKQRSSFHRGQSLVRKYTRRFFLTYGKTTDLYFNHLIGVISFGATAFSYWLVSRARKRILQEKQKKLENGVVLYVRYIYKLSFEVFSISIRTYLNLK